MNQKLTQWISLVLCLAALGVSATVFSRLPDQIPTHFDISGQPDQYGSRMFGTLVLPGVMAVMWLVLWALPKISPRGWRVEPFAAVWNRVQVALLAFMLLVHVGVLGYSLQWWGADLNRIILGGVGILFVTLGNYLGKTTRNFFLGIRTPWTLASDEVWRRTHRLGGWMFVAAGGVFIVGAFTGLSEPVLIGTIVVTALVPVVYSFFVYRSLEGFGPNHEED